MSKALSIAAAAALGLLAAGTAFAEYPTFQLNGLPITAHQVQIVGSAGVTEMLPAPATAAGAVAVSPHQALVLAPRQRTLERQLAATSREIVQLRLPRARLAR